MNEEPTTAAIQRYLDNLHGDTPAEPLIRELLERAVERLRILCGSLLRRSYPRLTQPPLNLETDELLDGVVARLMTTLQTVQPQTVRQFFALANQHMRWQLNDLARLLDNRPRLVAFSESGALGPPESSDSCLSQDARRMLMAIEALPADEREVFELVRIQGLSNTETAALVGVSIKTVQRRLNRARLLLAQELADLAPGGPEPGGMPEPDESARDTPRT
jgi:RNA polymerase sigma factor (sigma-70 family)